MAIQLYRRHRRECRAGHPEEFRSGEFDERRRSFKRCDCPLFGAGIIYGNRVRKSTGTWDWSEAKGIVALWESNSPPPITCEPEPQASQRTMLEDALSAFYARAQSKELLDSTLKKYRTFKSQMLAYAADRGII